MVAERPALGAVVRVLDASTSPALLVSSEEEIVAANQPAAVLTGATASEQLIGRSLDVFDLDHIVTERNRNLFRQVANGTILTLTAVVTFRRLDGTASSVLLAQTGVTLADGLFVLITAAGSPAGAAAPREPPVHDLAALVTDHDWRVTHATAAARNLLDADDSDGSALFGLIHPMDVAALASALGSLTYSGSSISRRLEIRCGDTWRPIVVAASALCAHSPPRLIVLLADARPWPSDQQFVNGDDRVQAAVVGLTASRAQEGREFSDQEVEIIARSLRGQRPAEIAEQMFLSRGTVRNALTRIYRQFGVRSQPALIAVILTGKASPESNASPRRKQ